ncbi:SulP family inorganic anion transporter [Sporocytophaga myxococcoides]|uniref:SulP family inorganic anion transporter n=1 Tax=Sporocytophaga myxococcoides TaxID=153721 RepID=UPI00041F05DC|nr:SulP family inorganic anion transporter [Sporocytophaga myxococcoides]
MESTIRKPFQGVTNIILFNWHTFVIALIFILLLIIGKYYFLDNILFNIAILATLLSIVISLVTSLYIYDLTDLYKLSFLDKLIALKPASIVNINAGFDEISEVVKSRYPDSRFSVFDFYDPLLHTEISIERARKLYEPYPETQVINTKAVPLEEGSVDVILLMFAAHEIRNEEERIIFFEQLRKAITIQGMIIVVEHQRDLINFFAYNIGFFHFYSKNNWLKVFTEAGLEVSKEIKITPFISGFALKKYGTAS